MNNRITAGRIQLIFTFFVLAFLALWVCSLTIQLLMLTWLQWTSALLFALTVYCFMYGGYFYFEILEKDKHIEIKYYNSFPFSREFKMFRIPVSAFVKYQIQGSLFFRRKLFVFQKQGAQMAKYPPIMVSAFSRENNEALHKFFAKVKKKGKK
ncbi:hypothetical protein SAMN06265379_101130 [Saccharicrinis carchari]|uniref:Uncharacterized protein n=1 Tax=Saccharicrinis carchari TaxID=1168039 RepID=A0A521AGE1_SACCC|nr:hypothetical protein [Saccharicrinis carchari]SMO33871.1 hypothetical protein SAMN06265379_101130 [Saccharicrinis carchari]